LQFLEAFEVEAFGYLIAMKSFDAKGFQELLAIVF